MKEAKFKVGDRVRMIKAQDGMRTKSLGTVKAIISCADWIAVEFDKNIDSLSCFGLCKPGHGWYCKSECLELVHDN